MSSALERLAGPGKSLAAEPPDAEEFAGLKHSGVTHREDAENKSNSLEGRFDLAYNAAHALYAPGTQVMTPWQPRQSRRVPPFG